MYGTSPATWWMCVMGIRAKDNPKNNIFHRAPDLLSGHTTFIKMRVKSLASSKKKPWC